jgi:ABC-type sugar transport system permease subunit
MSRVASISLRRVADRALVIPALAFCLVAGVLPLLAAILLSFTSTEVDGSLRFASARSTAIVSFGQVGGLRNISRLFIEARL